jgi:hypothetical protein
MESNVSPKVPSPLKKTTEARISNNTRGLNDLLNCSNDVDTTDDETNSSSGVKNVKKHDKIELLEQLFIAAHIIDNDGIILWANSYEVHMYI